MDLLVYNSSVVLKDLTEERAMMIAKILALTIFIVMFVLIITDKIEKCLVTLCCGLATPVLVFGLSMHSMSAFTETLNVRNIFTLGFWYEAGSSSESTGGVNWATIIFLAGMMIMVEGMAKAGFFRWLCMTIAKLVKYKVIPIFLTFMVMSFVLAMFIDSITVILFLAAVTVSLHSFLSLTRFRLFCRRYSVRTSEVQLQCAETHLILL